MDSLRIKKVSARQILDCKGRPAVEVDVITEGEILGRGGASTGTSVGKLEAYILRDNNPDIFEGLSVYKAIDNINNIIAPEIIGLDVSNQSEIDKRMIELDGTENKNKLGGNAIYAVSIACAQAGANAYKMPLYRFLNKSDVEALPIPTYNMINGGDYNNLSLAFQEITLVPYKCKTITENVEIGIRVFHKLARKIAEYQGVSKPYIGNYFAWAPPSDDPKVNIELLIEAVKECGVEDKVGYALDCASNEMYIPERGTYRYKGKEVDKHEIIAAIKELTETYNILYVEDIVEENDIEGFIEAVKEIKTSFIIGDDFTVTNVNKLKDAYEKNAVEGFIFKPNQVGTITECIETCKFAKEHNLLIIPSIRSGGIVDDAVMDLGIALGAVACKNGCPRTGERVFALNTLLRAESENPTAIQYDFNTLIKEHNNY